MLQSKQDADQPWRLTSFDAPDEKVLNANSAMRYGLEDVRGYDSIIPKQYVGLHEAHPAAGRAALQPDRADLLAARRPANDAALDNPLLNLLGVRYVVTTQTIPNAGYELVYDGEVKVYENTNAFPRAFIVPRGGRGAEPGRGAGPAASRSIRPRRS